MTKNYRDTKSFHDQKCVAIHEHKNDETTRESPEGQSLNMTRLNEDIIEAAKTACASATGRDVSGNSARSRIMMKREKKVSRRKKQKKVFSRCA